MFHDLLTLLAPLMVALSVTGFSLNGIPPQTGNTCLAPVSPKPQSEIRLNEWGSITITPEISQTTLKPGMSLKQEKNTITVSIVPNRDAQMIIISGFSKDSSTLVDWGPKDLKEKGAEFHAWDSKWGGSFTFETPPEAGPKRFGLQRGRSYWVKVHPFPYVPDHTDENVGSYGWSKVQYEINTGGYDDNGRINIRHGSDFFFANDAQRPSVDISRIGAQQINGLEMRLGKLKRIKLKPTETFEIEMQAIGQAGTIKADPTAVRDPRGNFKIIGSRTADVASNKTAIWTIHPSGDYSGNALDSVALNFNIQNSCGFGRGAYVSVPIEFDVNPKGISVKDLDLNFFSGNGMLTVGKDAKDSKPVSAKLHLSTQPNKAHVAYVNIPNIAFTFEAVYADNKNERVKKVLFTPVGSGSGSVVPQSGKITAATDKEGYIYLTITAPDLTTKEAQRGIVIKATAPVFPGLLSESPLHTNVPVIRVVSTPKSTSTPPKTTPIPKPVEKSVTYVAITPSRSLKGLVEGDKVFFTAVLGMSDGTQKSADEEGIVWSVVGKIGTINQNGVFEAKLDPSIAEIGEGVGVVTVIYTDKKGKTYLSKTETFKVELFIPDDTEMQG